MDLVLLSSIASISLLGAISPGPDFAIVAQNTLQGKAIDGIKTTLGVVLALVIHLTYTYFGLATLLSNSPASLTIFKYIGASYLIYLGTSMLKTPGSKNHYKIKRYTSPFTSGLFCNLLNPKAMLFILALFTQVMNAQTSRLESWLAMLMIVLTTLIWFTILSFGLSLPRFKAHLENHQRKVSVCMGILLSLLALKIIF